jgi:peptidoglycan/xylan/chitin deacetylase (PgdA/CDA1 family)
MISGPAPAVRSLRTAPPRRRIPVRALEFVSGTSLIVPYYHMVSDAAVPHVRHLYRFRSIKEFESDLAYLLRHFVPVELHDIVALVDGTVTLPRPSFHLTFDDGFREMHDVVAPILRRRGVPATFFLATAFLDQRDIAHHNAISLVLERLGRSLPRSHRDEIERILPQSSVHHGDLTSRLAAIPYRDRAIVDRLAAIVDVDLKQYLADARPYLCSEQVRSLIRQGFTIGAHSHDHPRYGDLPLADQIDQTTTSLDFLTAAFGIIERAFAFPHTDSGVGPEFFRTIFSTKIVSVSFGTAGLLPHFHRRNIERISMEQTSAPASQILARQYARSLYYRCRSAFFGDNKGSSCNSSGQPSAPKNLTIIKP